MWLSFHNPLAGFSLLVFEVSWSHTTTRHIRQDSYGRVTNPSQRPLPDNTQHSQQTNIHVPGGIRNHDLSRRAAEDLRLRPRGHWDRLLARLITLYNTYCARLTTLRGNDDGARFITLILQGLSGCTAFILLQGLSHCITLMLQGLSRCITLTFLQSFHAVFVTMISTLYNTDTLRFNI